MLRQILRSIVILFSPLSADSLCRLLHVTKEDVDQTLEDLHSILDIPDTIPFSIIHRFATFLLIKRGVETQNSG